MAYHTQTERDLALALSNLTGSLREQSHYYHRIVPSGVKGKKNKCADGCGACRVERDLAMAILSAESVLARHGG